MLSLRNEVHAEACSESTVIRNTLKGKRLRRQGNKYVLQMKEEEEDSSYQRMASFQDICERSSNDSLNRRKQCPVTYFLHEMWSHAPEVFLKCNTIANQNDISKFQYRWMVLPPLQQIVPGMLTGVSKLMNRSSNHTRPMETS